MERVIDLRDIARDIYDKRKQVVAITIVCAIFGGLYLVVATPTYQSSSMLRFKQMQGLNNSVLDGTNQTIGSDTALKQMMNTDIEILKSRNVVEPVIQKIEQPNSAGQYIRYEEYVKSHIETVPYKDTEIIQVNVTGKSPEEAQEANQLLIEGFVNRLAELSHIEQKSTKEFLTERVISSKKELDAAEKKLEEYQVANKIYSTDDQMKGLTDKITEIDKQKAQNQLDLETAQAALNSINQQLGSAGTGIADSPSIQSYKTQLAQLESIKASYVGKYTDENPKMKEINQQITVAQEGLNEQIQAIVNQKAPSSNSVQQELLINKFKNEAAIAVAQGKQDALASLESQDDASIVALPEKERGFIQAKRDVDVAQEIYVMLSKRLEESKVAEVMVPNEVQVVDSATLPEKPVKPRKVLVMALASIVGLILGCLYALLFSTLHRTIRNEQDVKTSLGLPLIGIIPDGQKPVELIKTSSVQSLFSKLRGKL